MSWYEWLVGGGASEAEPLGPPAGQAASRQRLERSGAAAARMRSEGEDELRRATARNDLPVRRPNRGSDPFVEQPQLERVLVRVYDLGTTILTHPHNGITRSYGAFHTGVEVFGREWSFGMSDDWRTGVTWCPPGKNPDHTFRETLAMGNTRCTFAEFTQILNEMKREWRGSTYSLLTRNCHHFSDALCRRLGVGRIPPWINDLAGVGDATATVIDSVYSNISISDAVSSVKSGLYFTMAGMPECFSGRRKPELEAIESRRQEDSDEEEPHRMQSHARQLREMPPARGDLVYPAQGEAVLVFGKMGSDAQRGTSSDGRGLQLSGRARRGRDVSPPDWA